MHLRHDILLVLLSFPTRRSSDLATGAGRAEPDPALQRLPARRVRAARQRLRVRPPGRPAPGLADGLRGGRRSEKHTSELQSRRELVCRLLLEKKKLTPRSIQKYI